MNHLLRTMWRRRGPRPSARMRLSLAVILVLVVETARLVGSNANNAVFVSGQFASIRL
jgi:hypothetical protein